MIFTKDRKRIIATLINACHDVEDALSQSASGARYDPVIIPQALRNELSVLPDQHLFVAVISAILGMGNGASALILRWKVQLACAIVWWVSAVATCFGTDRQSTIVFLGAIFLCQIVFGIYSMIAEGQQRKRRTPIHA